MGNFVTASPALPALKTDKKAPTGSTSELTSSDVNALWSAAGDLRDAVTAVSPMQYGAKGDGSTDDTFAIQQALNTGKDIVFPSNRTYRLGNSLYMMTNGQQLYGNALLTIDAALGKPCLWLGAQDSNGTPVVSPIINTKIRGLRFSGTGTKVDGSAGIAIVGCTTATLDSVFSWNFYAGIDIRGWALVNTLLNCDLRQNVYGLLDRTGTGTLGTIDFQGSQVFGGRIEANQKEGVVLGSVDVRFVGTIFEGNSNIGQGGTGAESEIRLTAGDSGFNTGSVDLIGCYMEILGANTCAAMISCDVGFLGRLNLQGGNFYANDAANRYVVKSLSAGTTQAFSFLGGTYKNFKNYLSATLINGCTVTVMPTSADASRDASVDCSVSAGASLYQVDRILGVKMTGFPNGINGVNAVLTAAAAANAISLLTGALINFGGTATLKGDGSQLVANGNLFLGGSGNGALHAGAIARDDTAGPLLVKANVNDGGVAQKFGNLQALATGKVVEFYNDNFITLRAFIDAVGRGSFNGGVSPGTDAGAAQTGKLLMGSGVPSNANGNNGDFYLRTDTPGSANQRLYVKSAGSWLGIL